MSEHVNPAETSSEETVTPKNIVICSDGTGNRGGKTRGTNIWRIFNAVDRHDAADRNNKSLKQITYYDDGVGTHDLRWLRLLGGASGWGLSRNIREAYAFLAMNYKPGDKVYLFGFSRGAFTVRSLAGVINHCGLMRPEAVMDAGKHRRRVLKLILKAYRSIDKERRGKFLGKVCEVLKNTNSCFRECPIPIHFIGVWDTVDAVGLPFDEIPLLDPILRRARRRRRWKFHDRNLGCHVRHAYQALSLDDERKTFYPLIWQHPNHCAEKVETNTEPESDRKTDDAKNGPEEQIIEQVWFAGAHANVGGGYPKDSMSLVSLDWMMGKAEACNLKFLDGARENVRLNADVHGRLYDSRVGLRAFYRYGPRNIYERSENPLPYDVKWSKLLRCEFRKIFKGKKMKPLPTPAIHASVFDRIERGTNFYATKVIRKGKYTVAQTDRNP